MEVIYITFRSITAAQRGERILKEGGIPASMLRTPRWMQERGCGYSLKLAGPRGAQAVEALRSRGGAFARVYVQKEDGQLKEAAL